MSQTKNILCTNVYRLYVGSGIWRKSFYAFLRAHSVKVIKSLRKHRTPDSVSQTRLKNKIFSSSLHDLPTKIDLPIKHHKTIILSYPFHVRAMSKLCAQAYTVQKLYTKSWKGSRFNNKTSDQIRWLPITSTDLSPDPSTFDTTSPRRSASLHPPDLHSIVANLVASEVKFFDGFVNAQGIGQGLEEMESRASRRWLVAKQKPKIWEAFRQYYQSGQSDKAAHRFCKHSKKKKRYRLQNEIQSVNPIWGVMKK